MSKALVLMAEGFEEIELTTIVDVLRRGGVTVTIAGLKDGIITGARGIKMQPDAALDSIREMFDIIILPGGSPGYVNLGSDRRVIELLNKYCTNGKIVAAICAPPPQRQNALGKGQSGEPPKGKSGKIGDFSKIRHFLNSNFRSLRSIGTRQQPINR